MITLVVAFALYLSAVILNSKIYSLVAVVYLLLLAWYVRGPFVLVYAFLALLLVYRHRTRSEKKTVFDKVLERYPVQTALLFAGICRAMVSRAPMVSALVESFSPELARELRGNPIGVIERMAQESRYPEVKRLVYATTDEEIKNSVQAVVSRLLQRKYMRAMVISAVTGAIMLASIELPLLVPLARLFGLLGGR